MEENHNTNNIPYQLILDELDGKISSDGLEQLKSWKALSTDNADKYHEIISMSDQLELLGVYQHANPEQAWNRFAPSLNENGQTAPMEIVHKRNHTFSGKWKFAAAAAAIIVIISFSLYQKFSNTEITVTTAQNQHQKLMLPDGTEVSMNGNTTLSYNKNTFQNSRQLKLLKGEAYFDVIHQEKNPFKIKTAEVELTDLGTSFDVKVDTKQVVVVVSSGKVALEHADKTKQVLLSPSDKGVFDRITKQITMSKNSDLNYKSWYDKKLEFVQSTLNNVAQDFEDLYGKKVLFEDPSLQERKLTASFENQSAAEVIKIIATSLQLRVEERDGAFLLKK